MLERFYYGTSYMIGSASRKGKMAAGLWGPWVHCDTPGWEGDFTIDYNHFANHWGLYANNRIDQVRLCAPLEPQISTPAWFCMSWCANFEFRVPYQAEPQYKPVLDFVPKARKQAAMYNCSGTHWPGHIAPFGFDSTLAGVPWASMSLHRCVSRDPNSTYQPGSFE